MHDEPPARRPAAAGPPPRNLLGRFPFRGPARPRSAAGTTHAEPEAKGPSMNILLIDDDPSLRKSLRLALETMGHRVADARDGGQAQEVLGHGTFDVAFLD